MIVIFMENQMHGKKTRAAQRADLDLEGSAEDPSVEGMLPVTFDPLCFWKLFFQVFPRRKSSQPLCLYRNDISYFLILKLLFGTRFLTNQ